MDRASITRMVYDRLGRDREFRERLVATNDAGEHPILITLVEDRVDSLLRQMIAVGGAANVVVPWRNGCVVMVMQEDVSADAALAAEGPLRGDCTVGVLLSRMHFDLGGPEGSVTYNIVMADGASAAPAHAKAEVVAVAG